MSALLLIRHAQASFLEDDYDKLSPHGEQQALRLGEHFAASGVTFDEVVVGPRRRHQRTAELVGQAMQASGLCWPQPVIRPAWDEHQVDRLMLDHAPLLVERHPHLRELVDAARLGGAPPERARRFQRLFEAVAGLWVANSVMMSGIETWEAFQARIDQGLSDVIEQPRRSRRIAVFTSVGAVTVALKRAMRCDDDTALSTGWRVWNSSITEFAFSGPRFTLDRFNALPHLPHPADWTYR